MRTLTAQWHPMIEKTNMSIGETISFTANNISGNVAMTNLRPNNDTYTYSGVNKTSNTITSIKVTLNYYKKTGKSESITCDVYSSYAAYQADNNHSAYLGTATSSIRQGTNTVDFILNLTGNKQLQVDDTFTILFSSVANSNGATFSGITIELT